MELEPGDLADCAMGCGLPAGPGLDRKGRPWTCCCRSCAKGLGYHDSDCWGAILAAEGGGPGPHGSSRQDVVAPAVPPTLIGQHHGQDAFGDPGGGTRPPTLCIMQCGLPVRPGVDKSGRPYQACCAGCIRGKQHDRTCQKTQSDLDMELALRTQRREYRRFETMLQSQAILQATREMAVYVWDPVWGEIVFKSDKSPAGVRRQSCAAFGFACCPCLMITCGCCKDQVHSGLSPAERRRAWRCVLLSWSMFFAVAQVALLLYPCARWGFAPASDNYMLGPPQYVFNSLGSKNTGLILTGSWWRLAWPMMLHAGILHLGSNLVVQLRTGMVLEALWGKTKWLVIYLGSGIYGFMASCIVHPNTLGIGSSGGLSGLIGAWPVFILITWNQTMPRDQKLRNGQLSLVVGAIILLVPTSFIPQVDTASHIGGLIAGFLLACIVFARRLQDRRVGLAVGISGLVATVLLFAVSLWLLMRVEYNETLLNLCTPDQCQELWARKKEG